MAKVIRANGQNVGYVRVSTILQNEARQLEGVDLDVVFADKISGRTKNRPELERCLKHLRAGYAGKQANWNCGIFGGISIFACLRMFTQMGKA